MGRMGRNLQPGDEALTDYNGPGAMTRVRIVARDDSRVRNSQSGVLYQVSPKLRNGIAESWYDADWFEPAPEEPNAK